MPWLITICHSNLLRPDAFSNVFVRLLSVISDKIPMVMQTGTAMSMAHTHTMIGCKLWLSMLASKLTKLSRDNNPLSDFNDFFTDMAYLR